MKHLCALTLMFVALACSAQESGERERVFLKTAEQFDSAKAPADFAKAGNAWRDLNSDDFQNGAAY